MDLYFSTCPQIENLQLQLTYLNKLSNYSGHSTGKVRVSPHLCKFLARTSSSVRQRVILDVRDFVSKRKARRQAASHPASEAPPENAEAHSHLARAGPAAVTGETHAEASALSNAEEPVARAGPAVVGVAVAGLAVAGPAASHGEGPGVTLTRGSTTRRRSRAIAALVDGQDETAGEATAALVDGQGGMAGAATTSTSNSVPPSAMISPTSEQGDREGLSPAPPPIVPSVVVETSSPPHSHSIVTSSPTASGKRHAGRRTSSPLKHKRAPLRVGPVDTSIIAPDLNRCSSCCFRTDPECERQMIFLLYESVNGKADYAVVGRNRFGAFACVETSQKCSVTEGECQHVRLARQAQELRQQTIDVTAATTDQRQADWADPAPVDGTHGDVAATVSAAATADETQATGSAVVAAEETQAISSAAATADETQATVLAAATADGMQATDLINAAAAKTQAAALAAAASNETQAAAASDETQADGVASPPIATTRAYDTSTTIPTTPAEVGIIIDLERILTDLAHRVHHGRRYTTLIEGDRLIVLRIGRSVSCLACRSSDCYHIRATLLPSVSRWSSASGQRDAVISYFDVDQGTVGEWVAKARETYLSTFQVPFYADVKAAGTRRFDGTMADPGPVQEWAAFNRRYKRPFTFENVAFRCKCNKGQEDFRVYLMSEDMSAVIILPVCTNADCQRRVKGLKSPAGIVDDLGVDERFQFYVGAGSQSRALGISVGTVQTFFYELCRGSRTIAALYDSAMLKIHGSSEHSSSVIVNACDNHGPSCTNAEENGPPSDAAEAQLRGPQMRRLLSDLYFDPGDDQVRVDWIPR